MKEVKRIRKMLVKNAQEVRNAARKEKQNRKLACYSQNSDFAYDWYNPDWIFESGVLSDWEIFERSIRRV